MTYSQIEEGTTITEYEQYKGYTKTLYLNSPLLEGDSIEVSGNDIVHVHRYKEVVLDGSEAWGGRNGSYYIERHDMKRLQDYTNKTVIKIRFCDRKTFDIWVFAW